MLGGALALGALLAPPVQVWLVKRVVARQPGWRVDFERFGVGASGLDAQGLAFSMPGLTATSAPIAVRIWPSRLLRRELHIEQVDVQKLRLELTPAQLESTPPSSEPFAGLLALLQAPLPWVVEQTNIEAQIVVNDGGQSVVVGDLKLQGGGLRPGQDGTFTYELDVASALLPTGPDHRVRSRGQVRVAQGPAYGVERIRIDGDLILPSYGPLTLPAAAFDLEVTATPEGEAYTAGLRFGTAAALTFTGELARDRGRLTGTLGLRADDTLLASLTAGQSPAAQLAGSVAVNLDLASFDFDAELDAGLDLHDWARLLPELAPVDALTGRLRAAVAARGPRIELSRFDADLRGAGSALAFQAALAAPVDLAARPAGPRLKLSLEGLPLAWANPWLGEAVRVEGGALRGAWRLELTDGPALRLSADEPTRLGPILLAGPALPALPPLALQFRPRLEASARRIALASDDVELTSERGDRVSLTLRGSHDLDTRASLTTGSLAATLPTLLSGADRPLPFTLAASWDAGQSDTGLTVRTFDVVVREPARSAPVVTLALRQPVVIGPDGAVSARADEDLLRFAADALPLDWLSRWLPGYEFAGTWAGGSSVLRASATGSGFALTTTQPWTFAGLGLGVGGKTLFRGRAALAPELTLAPDRIAIRLGGLDLADDAGSRLGGEASFDWAPRDRRFATTLALDASLPALPHSAGTFGAVTARLHARAGSVEGQVSQVESFRLEARNADGPLVTLDAPQPFYFFVKPSGELILSSVAPLSVDVARIPLAWLQPWLPDDVALGGTAEPARLLLVAEPQKFFLRATAPVRVTDFSYRRRGAPRVEAASGWFYPGADLTLLHAFKPAFQLGYLGRLHATDGTLDVAGARTVEFEAALGFIGNDRTALPQTIDTAVRVDFAALHRVPVLAENGVPAAGTLVLRANGDLLGGEPVDVWAQVSGVPEAGGGRALPDLTVAARGRTSGETRTLSFDVSARLGTAPRASDAAFMLRATPGEEALTFDSAFRSAFIDLGEALALARAFEPPAAPPADEPAAAGAPAAGAAAPGPAAPLGVPFWSTLRGRFDLDLEAVRYAPYRIDGVRGRLELTDHALVLSDLAGEMFAGRWGGDLRVDYDPAAADDHRLTARFRIDQFETARAIQTVFPNEFGSVDTQLSLATDLRSAGRRWWELMERAEGRFTLEGRNGVVRLTHPQAGTASTVLALAGTVGFSPELRALGRLLKAFAEMPLDEVRIQGARDAAGNLVLDDFRLDSPQARLRGRGRVPAEAGVPLAGRALDVTMELEARDEVAVILGRMKLLERQALPGGYRRLSQPVVFGGAVGRPDPSPLYDLLARAVEGSGGTWGLIMRKVQREVEKQSVAAARAGAALRP